MRIANEVAIYILNQKRHELARIETEHGMDISFEPKEDLAAGSFELERTKSRDPGERPRNSAVSIEAGFVPSSEPEPDYVEEVDEEEEFVASDGGREEADDEDGEERTAPPQGERSAGGARDGERDGGRKRRRRGGRGRNRDREGPRPSGADTGVAAAAPAPSLETASADDSEFEPAGPGAPLGENGEPRRKRRRRRGRRGGRDREGGPAEAAPQAGFAPAVDRFGPVPDEIDTTPSDGRHAPGAPSAPVWSLKDDIPDTTPSDEPKSTKKGWWQRTFSGE